MKAGTALRCLRLPIGDASVLLPASVVAQVLAAPRFPEFAGAVNRWPHQVWWRGSGIPFVHYARLRPGRAPGDGACPWIAVIKCLGASRRFGHYALAVSAAPGVADAAAIDREFRASGDEEWVRVQSDGEHGPLCIPDLERLERLAESDYGTDHRANHQGGVAGA